MTKPTKGTFPILMGGQKHEVEGYIIGAFGIRKVSTQWTVTHITSGLAITLCARPTLKEATAIAEQLDKLPINWCVDQPGLGKQPGDLLTWREVGACVKAIARGKTAFEAIMKGA